ncbi:hypothetical protein SAMN05444273_101612 [Litoreibacter ascidiaceicola]|uniref:Curlin associated repeat-containing protein n=1 Tax=Litoreibacter ascidiaceicola TaxID=1486859 RepID=A0A1M4U0J9_9RHOB|nr:hypothetical protein [Litoreibacter ascidiaceicola]SHE50255.1 hypothetical protein SAMN05444273_101612 [Litoreibacter ascidiaceicola]
MKTIIAILALSAAAPAFADVSNPQAFFALGNDSAAERVVGETSTGDLNAALWSGVSANESAAEQNIVLGGTDVSRNVQAQFALGNDSAAERFVK